MHLIIQFKARDNFVLPINYNHIVQSAIYKSIDPKLADFLHNRGYKCKKRTFKMFSFSRLQGRFILDKDKKKICFSNSVKLIISSPMSEFCQSLANTLLCNGYMNFGNLRAEVNKIQTEKNLVETDSIKIETLSPIVIYSTLFRQDGSKYTCYYQANEPEYNELLNRNIQNKYKAFYGNSCSNWNIKVKTLSKQNLHIVHYKKTVIKGYSGLLLLEGEKQLLQLAVDAGLGSKNSQGFGCIRIYKRKENLGAI